jgi:YVTN family beta-propeller protein
MSALLVVCNNVNAQTTLDNILEQRKIFENNPQIQVGLSPSKIAINQKTSKVYITNEMGGTVSIIDTNSGKTKDIRVGDGPDFITVDDKRNKIYVANSDSNTVSVIDGNNDTEAAPISVGAHPTYIVELLNKIYVLNSDDDSVSVINTINDTKEPHDIPLGEAPFGGGPVSMASGGGKIYVLNSDNGDIFQNSNNDSVSVINTNNDTKKPHDIPLGEVSGSMAVGTNGDFFGFDKIYVANIFNTVSVIDTTNDTKEPHDIPVGNDPVSMAVGSTGFSLSGPEPDTIYVLNSDSVSVISVDDDKKEPHDIPVGNHGPVSMAVFGDKIYLANEDGNTVSVIDTNNGKLHHILVGSRPSDMGVLSKTAGPNYNSTRMIYVANRGSNTVSVIDGSSDKVAAAVTLKIHPENSGKIMCDGREYPTNIYLYVDNGTICNVQPNKDLQFIGWTENLNQNSTIPISDSPGNLIINRYGTFTANFKPAILIPDAYLFLIISVIVTSMIGWSWTSIVGWVKARTQRKNLRECLNQIGRLDKNAIEEKIIGYYVDGKLSEDHRQLLKDKISEYYGSVKGSESGA